MKSRKRRKQKRLALVHTHLEHVDRTLLKKYFDIVQKYIGRNSGVYALYRKRRLYYVGLALHRLSKRLRDHVRDHHENAWDSFSVYGTINDQHLNELEALLLRIANPRGNKQRGKLAASKDIKRLVKREIKRKHELEVSHLFSRLPGSTDGDDKNSKEIDDELMRLLPRGGRLKGTSKGRRYNARVRRNGTIRYNGRIYSSLSHAATVALKRSINGWYFWKVERSAGNWVRLKEIRRAGTPILP